jgi:signal transduction histidine kinase/CheY-like chemotaxis protein
MTMFTLTVFLISLWSITFYAGYLLENDMKKLAGDGQLSTVSYIASAINEEIIIRIDAIKKISKDFSNIVLSDNKQSSDILENHPIFQSLFNGGTFITDTNGTATASIPEFSKRIGVNYLDRDYIYSAIKEGKTSVGRPVLGKTLHNPIISICTPIYNYNGTIIGALAGVIDLGKPNFLDKITSNKYGNSGKYTLVSPKNRMIITDTSKINVLKYLHPTGDNSIIDRFIAGYEGTGIEANEHGVKELISAKSIPAAGWYVAVSQPLTHALAPIHTMQHRIVFIAILITIIVIGLSWWMLRNLLAPMTEAVKYIATAVKSHNNVKPLPIKRKDEIGELIGSFNNLLEILTQRDKSLQDNQRQLADIIKFLPTATLAIDNSGRVIIWNEAVEQMTGVSASEMLGKKGYAHSFPFYGEIRPQLLNLIIEDIDKIEKMYPNVFRSGDNFACEIFCSFLNKGKGAWIFAKAAPLHDQYGNVIGAIESVRDITERKQSEHYNALGRDILNILNEPMDYKMALHSVINKLKDKTGFDAVGIRLKKGNDYPYIYQEGFSHDFLFTENTVIARNKNGDICTDDSGRLQLECTCGLVLSGKTDSNNILFTQGGSFWTNNAKSILNLSSNEDPRYKPRNLCIALNYSSIALIPIRDKDEIIGLIQLNSYHKDALTASIVEHLEGIATHLGSAIVRKQAEEQTRELQAQLLQSQKMEAIGTLAGGIAHDFNNILGAILGYADIAKGCVPLNSLAAKHLDKVIVASQRAATLVRQILTFSRQARIERIPLQPSHIVREAIKLLRPSLPSTITIQQTIDPETKCILADPTQLHQILMNLCTNAFHAMEKTGGILDIALTNCTLPKESNKNNYDMNHNSFVLLSVSDTGCGISPDIREKIFDPYFTTKSHGKGTGMGLSIIHGIVNSYGGFITCDSQQGQGTIFKIFFPAIDDKNELSNQGVEYVHPGKEKLLLVDDEEILADLGQVMLEQLGYVVIKETNSFNAWKIFQENPYQFDAVITDQTMPYLTGMDLSRKILQVRPEIPVILCTGYSNLIDEKQAKNEGVRGFIMKPFIKKEIASLLRAVIDDAEN